MRLSSLLLPALTCLMLVPAAARADSYTFTLTPVVGAPTVFSLNTAGVGYGADTVFSTVAGSSTVFGRVDLFNNGGYAPFILGLCSNGNPGGCLGTENYFQGTPVSTSTGGVLGILTGTFSVLNASGGTEALTIVDNTTAVTPEPTSLALLGTGMLGMFAVVKRRLA